MSTVTPGSTFRALFVPRAFANGAPIGLANVVVELVRASDFTVVDDTAGTLVVATSGAPNHEYLVTGSIPTDAAIDDLYFYRFSGESDGSTYRAIATAVVGHNVQSSVQTVIALVAAGGCC